MDEKSEKKYIQGDNDKKGTDSFEVDKKSEGKSSDFSDKQKKKKSKGKRWWFYLIIFVLFVTFVVYLGLDILGRYKAPSVSDENLVAPQLDSSVNAMANGIFVLEKAAEELKIEDRSEVEGALNKALAGKSLGTNQVSTWLKQNQNPLSLFVEAAGKNYIQFPGWKKIEARNPEAPASFPDLESWKTLSRLQALKILYLAEIGENQGAMEEALTLLKFSDNVISSPRLFLRQFNAGLNIKKLVSDVIYHLIKNSELTGDDLKKLEEGIADNQTFQEGLKNALKVQYTYSKRAVDKLGRDRKIPLVPFLPEEQVSFLTKVLIKNHYFYSSADTNRLQAQYIFEPPLSVLQSKSCAKWREAKDTKESDLEKLRADLSELNSWRWHFGSNNIGKLYVIDAQMNPFQFVERACDGGARLKLLQVVLALKNYQLENGELPSSLSRLAPRYISQLPDDPFSEGKLKYSKTDSLVYSVGSDLEDNGGAPEADIVLSIPLE